MTPVCRVYSQLLQLFPGGQFAQVVKQHQAEFNAKGFTCWEQFVAMLFCQMTHMNSLREVCVGLAGCESPLKHLGVNTMPIVANYAGTPDTASSSGSCAQAIRPRSESQPARASAFSDHAKNRSAGRCRFHSMAPTDRSFVRGTEIHAYEAPQRG